MRILAIETSCDETSIAALDGPHIVSLITNSQIEHHQPYRGIVPEIASRQHTDVINLLLKQALDQAHWRWSDIEAVAVTYGPGLEGALLVGLSAAKTIATTLNCPLLPINHLHGHIYSAFIDEKPTFPFIVLLVSGGHCLLAKATDHFQFEQLGQTRDDAIGEAFDKVARLLALPYPGGPEIDRLATTGKATIAFPKGLHKSGLDFSYSGLKSAVYRYLQHHKNPIVADVAASFQKAACDSLIDKAMIACQQTKTQQLIICGGVSANHYLRTELTQSCHARDIALMVPKIKFCTDNAAMIGLAGHFMQKTKQPIPTPVHVKPSLAL